MFIFHRENVIKQENSPGICFRGCFDVVEPRGIEPLSESNLERTSPGAVCYLHSLSPAGTNTLRESVASLCVVWAKLTIRTFSA